jgi:hypothetical protein
MPDELYIDFTIQVLKDRGPKQKMKVLHELVERYVREAKEKREQGLQPAPLEPLQPHSRK